MTIRIADRDARTAIHLQAMQPPEYVLRMALAKSQLAKQTIMSITTPVRRTAPQTAGHMAHNAMSQMQIINVKIRHALLHAMTDLNNQTIHAYQTSLFQYGM